MEVKEGVHPFRDVSTGCVANEKIGMLIHSCCAPNSIARSPAPRVLVIDFLLCDLSVEDLVAELKRLAEGVIGVLWSTPAKSPSLRLWLGITLIWMSSR